jgi:hypothetical protein
VTFYQKISPVQPPYDAGKDDNGAQQVAFDALAVREGTTAETFLDEVVKVLEDAGLGTYGTDIFASSGASLPSSKALTFLTLYEDPGMGPQKTQNRVSPPAWERPIVHVIAHAATYAAAKARARAASNALATVVNTDVTL